jgi:hypothetical protein
MTIELNRKIEERWRKGEISFAAFNRWLLWFCGV